MSHSTLARIVICLSALPLFAAYTYYRSDTFSSINSTIWQTNGSISGSGSLVSTTAGGGSVISKETVPGAVPNSHEVRAKLNLGANGGSYILYLRASADAWLNLGGTSTGTFVALEITNPVFSGTGCTATLNNWSAVAGTVSWHGASSIPCYNGMEVRAVAFATSGIMLFIDGLNLAFLDVTTVTTGRPGVGGAAMPSGNSIARVDLGQLDQTAPSAVPSASIATAVFDTRVEFQWPGADDGVNGIGIWGYQWSRDGVSQGLKQSAEAADLTVSPGTTYSYSIQPLDYHGNYGAGTTFSVTTPAAGNIDPRKLGVRPLGTYWGALGEQIDLLTGNLNYSMPLFKALGRGGWGVTFALSYNSQNWRRDTAGTARTWNHARDIGYGYGWKMSAGSMTPVFKNFSEMALYRFTDSSGAEYRFTEKSGTLWTSKEGLFLTFDAATKKLYFPDGSWWYFGAVASGTEMDTGTMHPTLFQDANGNQIKARYAHGKNMGGADGSGRVLEVEDMRVTGIPPNAATYTCSYVNDPLQHLNTCVTVSGLGTGENYQVGLSAATNLVDPFSGAAFGTKQTLDGITNITPGATAAYYFGYDAGVSSGPGEMTRVVFPYGGYLGWTYLTGELAGGRQFRKVSNRTYNANDGKGDKTAVLHLYPGPSINLPVHEWAVLVDPTGVADKAWLWTTTLGAFDMGQLRVFADRTYTPSLADLSYKEFFWAQTANGNVYLSASTNLADPGKAYARRTKTEQAVSDFGNLIWRKELGFQDVGFPILREYAYTYEHGTPYLDRHIRNLVKKVTVTQPGMVTPFTLVENTFDGYVLLPCGVTMPTTALNAMSGATQHDTANYSNTMVYRGNVTKSVTPGGSKCMSYNVGGAVTQAWDGYGHSASTTMNPSRNYAVPSAMTAGGYTTSLTFDATLNLTQNSGPNGALTIIGWDTFRRETNKTLPNGQTVTHTYGMGQAAGASWHKVSTGISPNFRWVKTVFDGFGRTLETTNGYAVGSTETAVSKVVTEFTPCACSPIGKVLRTSMPFAAGGSAAHWTTYDYDAVGRTVKVTPPGSAGFTTYTYEGTAVKTTEPNGNWKRFQQDASGNLWKVFEPNPAGGEFETSYTYSMFGQLLTVNMTRPGILPNPATVTQTRTFVYNNEQRLQSVTHPESGTTTYSYNFDGSVKDKIDAKGQKVTWTYDSQGRTTDILKYEVGGAVDPCGHVKYYYDSQAIDLSFAGTNLSARVAAVETGCAGTAGRGGLVEELYSYNAAGAVLTKRVRITRGSSTVTKDIGYTFDAEGKLATVQYPDVAKPFTYGYDSMGRPNTMTGVGWDAGSSAWNTINHVTGVSYGVAGELLGMTYLKSDPIQAETDRYFVESRTYNNRLQLTQQTTAVNAGATVTNIKYNFSTSANDGRITSRENLMTGETVSYAYDSLNRLITASTSTAAWGLSFTYDGFGNRWDQTVSTGTAPPMHIQFAQATNRISSGGYVYDANGNMTTVNYAAATFDVDNRMLTHGGVEEYGYLADNKRMWKSRSGAEQYYLYGVGGQSIMTYSATYSSGTLTLLSPKMDVSFGGRLIRVNGTAIVSDRLGSVATRSTGSATVEQHEYFPFGEERATPASAGDRAKFGTYHRDQTGLDYADQRYYNSAIGQFLTSDPYEASGGTGEPGSWGRLAYVGGDPVNHTDPRGLAKAGVGHDDCAYSVCVTDKLETVSPESLRRGVRGPSGPGNISLGLERELIREQRCEASQAALSDESIEALLSGQMEDEERADLNSLLLGSVDSKDDGQKEVIPYAVAALTATTWFVYVASTPAGARYIGITTNLMIRSTQHGPRFIVNGQSTLKEISSKLTYAQAKGIEQALIEGRRATQLPLENMINSVSPLSPYYNQFKRMGEDALACTGQSIGKLLEFIK